VRPSCAMPPDDQDQNYIAVLEREIEADHRGTGRLALLILALIAVLLCLVPLQQRFGHDDFRPRHLR
jgi:hypothetical protein